MLKFATRENRPATLLSSGRYLLDKDGLLTPIKFAALVAPVAAVTVRIKPEFAAGIDYPVTAPEPEKTHLRPLARKAKPTRLPRIPDEDTVVPAKREPVSRVRAIQVAAKIDTKAIAGAFRARAATPKPQKRIEAPKDHARSPEPCIKCGANGWRGCEHQLPFQGYDTPSKSE